MAENKKSFIAYVDWKETFDALPNEKAGELIKHIFAYVNDENPKTDDILINAVFVNIKQTLKRDLVKWEDTSTQRAEIGRLGGIKSGEARRSKTKQLLQQRSKTKQNEHDNDNVNDNDIKEKIYKKENLIKVAEFVSLKQSEIDGLKSKYGDVNYQKMVEVLDNYKGANGKKYKSDYRAILNWVVEKVVGKEVQVKKKTITYL